MIKLKFLAYFVLVTCLSLLFTACGGGGSSNSTTTPNNALRADHDIDFQGLSNTRYDKRITNLVSGMPAVMTPNNNDAMQSCKTTSAVPTNANLTGTFNFKRPLLSNDGKLDFDQLLTKPARGIYLEALEVANGSCTDHVVQTTIVDGNGDFGFALDNGMQYCLRARAQMYRSGERSWDYSVTDNTRSNAAYYFLLNSPVSPSGASVDLIAKTGWNAGSSSYTSPRVAAPFAILDVACEAMDDFINKANLLNHQPLTFRWSKENNTDNGLVSTGDIGGAFYTISKAGDSGRINEIYLLGEYGSDTDEFDYHVIAHEMIHYLSYNYSRSDSMGGTHAPNDYLDLTIAFDEGFASGLATIILSDLPISEIGDHKIYRDSLSRDSAFHFMIDQRSSYDVSKGWYSETSVYKTIYDLFEDDATQITLEEMFSTLFKQKQTDSVVSIFSFIAELKKIRTDVSSNIDNLLALEGFESINDHFGSDETVENNNIKIVPYEDLITPIFRNLILGEKAQNICSFTDFKVSNGLGVYQRFKFYLANEQEVNVKATLTSGMPNSSAPVIAIDDRENQYALNVSSSSGATGYLGVVSLPAGSYVISIAAKENTLVNGNHGRYCYDFSVQ